MWKGLDLAIDTDLASGSKAEMIGNWTLVGEVLELLAGRRGPTKLGFASLADVSH
jgi:hypothetical protein